MTINISDYGTLNTYAVLAGTVLSAVNSTSVINGRFYGTTTPGNFYPILNLDNVNYGAAQTQLTDLITDISNVSTDTILGTGGLTNFTPGCYRCASSITFVNNSTITLDALGDSNAQFFIIADQSITFNTGMTITLTNGARNCNVFWLARVASITFATPPLYVPGIFVAGASISFNGGVVPSISGRLYAKAAITFAAAANINAACSQTPVPYPPEPGPGPGPGPGPIVSDICFPGDTPIETDQGIMCIKDVDATKHTIGDEKIIAITQTITLDEYLVCFEKDALGENCPDKQTLISKSHKIEYKGRMVEAYKFMASFKNVYPVQYNGETLYNVLMENYRTVQINQLSCETLHPSNITAQMYILQKFDNLEELNTIVHKNHKKYGLNKKMKKLVLDSMF